MASQSVAKVAQAANRVIPVHKKYTVQSTGLWETIRRFLAVDPTRSNGVPLNPQFRNPPPGSNEPFSFIDPVTLPAGDIAENPYWKRDSRRSYPQLSFVAQSDVVGLLSVGSEAAPRKELVGETGVKELVRIPMPNFQISKEEEEDVDKMIG
ncbi:putative nadh-ubiquinone oxidoreductase kda subunit protein [Botrytis fragariae]|uniref:Putative nadh-ubiquinone oxidoreductase kDa subunit protein n=1 Tax=Botrytis fragariae TaxID=1964551 RepID=A0A8H6ALC8_9HELO|nr:putative nadh-ubiquinone oxidoreductase kda subunit protein [Botrytis fragariae]KAF5869466.1 putative nadh-ubiquinone oxidoreductase kda subunit protein [Botrytis fragariae]